MFQLFLGNFCARSGGQPADLRLALRLPAGAMGAMGAMGAAAAGALATLALGAVALPPPAHARSPWEALLAGFEARGVMVRSDHPRCAERDLEGLYRRGRREVVVCPRGDRSITLRHEAWHLAQTLCLAGQPWLDPATVQRQLGRRDRREVERLVPPPQWPREAEARVMARLAPDRYFEQWDRACAGRLSPPPASPDRPASSR